MNNNLKTNPQAFFTANINLVYYLSNKLKRKYYLKEEDQEELISAGKLALWDISCNQDLSSLGLKTYMYLRIKGEMIDLLRKRRQVLKIKVKVNQIPLVEEHNYPFHTQPKDKMKKIEDSLTIKHAYQNLSNKEQSLIKGYYYEDKQFKDIFSSKSKSWISKFHSQTLEKLRSLLTSEEDDRALDIC